MSIQNIIKEKLDQLQQSLLNGEHLQNPGEFEIQLSELSLYFPLMSDEDRDYVHCARVALEDQLVWEV